MQIVVETPSYLNAAEKLFSSIKWEAIVAMVSGDPDCGDLITGTGGSRQKQNATSWRGWRMLSSPITKGDHEQDV
jgi:hypothetical protein